jgi:Ca2+-binding EF-hand superfamily protein
MSRVAQTLAALAGVTAMAAALAQTQTPTATAVFESLDKNADGKVTLAEASNDDELFVAFKGLDKDKNGELSKEEFAGFQSKKRGAS